MNTKPAFTPPEVITVTSTRIGCDGGAAASQGAPNLAAGHPLVYLTIGAEGTVDCPYCGRHFVLDPRAARDDHGH